MAEGTGLWELSPDRLLPADPAVRGVARRILAQTAARPIVSPHGHVDPWLLVNDEVFPDPASLFVTPDHYVTRLLHAAGVPWSDLGVDERREDGGPADGPAPPLGEERSRLVWRALCRHWRVLAGTAVRDWLEAVLVEVFEAPGPPGEATADAIHDHLMDRLARPDHRPRALFERFDISVLATTDDPCSTLAAHQALAADPTWTGRVVPTFRPDRYLEAGEPAWAKAVQALAESAQVDTDTHQGFLSALEARRRFFVANGATSADHSHPDVRTDPLGPTDADRIHRLALAGRATPAEAVAYRRHLLSEMARMSCEDGLVMTLHPAVRRNHHGPTAVRFGPDRGHDIPVAVEWTDSLRPLLQRFGLHPGFHLVLFTLDETTWSRELAPLAGFYPSVYLGAPWWFLDSPAAIRRFREAVTDIAGFARTSGFVDDTRAFCSIPARHDMARRIDAGVLAAMVAEHRLDETEATEIALDLAGPQAERVFKLDSPAATT